MLSELLNRNTRWVEVADTKAAAVLFFVGAIVRVIADPVMSSASDIDWSEVWALNSGVAAVGISFLIAAGGIVFAALWTVYHAFRTLLPRVVQQEGRGRMFFADIAERGAEEWEQSILSATPADLIADLLRQVHATSTIATRKHRHVGKAIIGVFAVLLLAPILYMLSIAAS